MKIAYFDTIAGISGDMTLGAFISAGVSLDELTNEIKKLNLQGIELDATRIERSGISAIKFDVIVSTKRHHHRHLKDIFKIIDGSLLSEKIKVTSKNIFMEVAKAEAKVHNLPVGKVHFHEVGALDSIVDIVGAAICFERLGIEKVYSSPVKLGSGGFVETEHGKLPIPSPAVVEILKGYPTVLTDIPFELTTPTGAAIIKTMSSGVLSAEKIKVKSIGYGAGSKEIPQIPNLLRVMIGEIQKPFDEDDVVVIETNIDDMNPEIYPYVIEQLLQHGASDAYLIPIIMKKGRPGILLSVLVSRSELEKILNIIYQETTTLGVCIIEMTRKKIKRDEKEVMSKIFGRVKMKVITYEGKQRLVPEFEECKRIASENKISLQEIYRMLEKEFS
ncbi:MAG: nickel pincer cofactor biosynthesis protein LarC [Bacteroidota bacterium]|nr:nickel pincer cofactor biosynthesis protein LarC [Bacteroidota bacterium]